MKNLSRRVVLPSTPTRAKLVKAHRAARPRLAAKLAKVLRQEDVVITTTEYADLLLLL